MTEQSGIRCPKCGAYLTGKIAEGVSYATCPYCNTALLIPKKETRQQIQQVIVLTKDEARQVREYGKLLKDMTEEEKKEAYKKDYEKSKLYRKEAEFWWREPWVKQVTILKLKKKDEGLTAKEERELLYGTDLLVKCNSLEEYNSYFHEYCQWCFGKKEVSCVNCGIKVCGYDDCELIHHEVADHFSRKFVGWDPHVKEYVSFYCPNCGGFVCLSCRVSRWNFFGREDSYCGKCQTKLEKKPPHYTMRTH